MALVLALLVVMAAMTVQDITGTICVVAEAKGHGRLAGLMDAGGDVARALTASVTTEAIFHGLGVHSAIILTALALTSYNVTNRTVNWSRRLKEGPVNPVQTEAA